MDKTRAEALRQQLLLAAISSEGAACDCRRHDKEADALGLAGRAHAYRHAAQLLNDALADQRASTPDLFQAAVDELKHSHALLDIAQSCMSSHMRCVFAERAAHHGHGGTRSDERVAVLTRAAKAAVVSTAGRSAS